ncbi:glycosyltransferase family 4 protein [Vibrio coralliilyticus]|uniref:glycosyltransferase family 4 protein n=1 Tax=Vibrio coralliilyticus TaxID=190893 RepID=UPI0006CD23C4|nr:glycosyltransferase family 4 protein [Vibrio coralliilyticus]ANW24189.1 glycosyltransferase WbuB [Vibrio coralliilyticus]AXN32124.1 glycosyltransferase WbuB [Vibrio coralliilyticus]KPH26354.1 glycosyl transferase family 1 [Vibrio coralliilyticus]
MHILFLTDNFPPEGNAPATRTYEHARVWVKLGHKVTIVTGVPNFPEGKVFKGYKNRWFQKETVDGIEVRRVKTYITANEGFAKRILDFMSFMVTSFFAGLFVKKPDVIIGTSPQFFTAVSAWALSAIRLKPFVFELRDIWPASITAVGAMRRSLPIRILEKIEMFLYHRADKIISVTHSFKSELIERGVDGNKIDVVLNGVDLTQYEPTIEKDENFAEQYDLKCKFVVGYVGTHGLAHALDKIIEAAKHLTEIKDLRIVFAGGGAAKADVERLVNESGLKNIVLIPRQPKELMPQLWSLCDISLISLKDTELFKTVIPSKIFESMGMGLPMVMTAPEGEATEIVAGVNSGLIVKPESPEKVVEAICELYLDREKLKMLAENSHKAAKLYDRNELAKTMLHTLEELCAKK